MSRADTRICLCGQAPDRSRQHGTTTVPELGEGQEPTYERRSADNSQGAGARHLRFMSIRQRSRPSKMTAGADDAEPETVKPDAGGRVPSWGERQLHRAFLAVALVVTLLWVALLLWGVFQAAQLVWEWIA